MINATSLTSPYELPPFPVVAAEHAVQAYEKLPRVSRSGVLLLISWEPLEKGSGSPPSPAAQWSLSARAETSCQSAPCLNACSGVRSLC